MFSKFSMRISDHDINQLQTGNNELFKISIHLWVGRVSIFFKKPAGITGNNKALLTLFIKKSACRQKRKKNSPKLSTKEGLQLEKKKMTLKYCVCECERERG